MKGDASMACTHEKQLARFPNVRVMKKWFRTFNNDKTFKNDGTLHLFSLMALYSYAGFRSHTGKIGIITVQEKPGQWTCKLSSLPRILRVHSMAQASELMEYFQKRGFLTYHYLDTTSKLLQFTICDWEYHCANLRYNYYSYKGAGFFFFPLLAGRKLLRECRREGKIVFSELDAIMDMWLHTVVNDETVMGSGKIPVVYFANMGGKPLLSYSYLAQRWGWSKSRVGRFVLKLETEGLISRISFKSSHGTIISMNCYREMLFDREPSDTALRQVGEILSLVAEIEPAESRTQEILVIENPDIQETVMYGAVKSMKMQVLRRATQGTHMLRAPMIFYIGIDCSNVEVGGRHKGREEKARKGADYRELKAERGGKARL